MVGEAIAKPLPSVPSPPSPSPPPPPPPWALDPVLIFQNYLHCLFAEREQGEQEQELQQQQQNDDNDDNNNNNNNEPQPDHDPLTEHVSHNNNNNNNNNSNNKVPKKKERQGHDRTIPPPPRSQNEIDQILQVVHTLFGSIGREGNNQQQQQQSSSSYCSSLVEEALSILDAAETNITRVISLSSRRSMYLVRSNNNNSSNNKKNTNRHQNPSLYHHDDNNNEQSQQVLQPQDSKTQQHVFEQQPHQDLTSTLTETMTTIPSFPATTPTSPLYHFCFLPNTCVFAPNVPWKNDSFLFYCSCPCHFNQTCCNHHDNNNNNTGKIIICEHLLALLLVPALGIQTALLELPNDHQFGELIMGRIGLS